MLGDSHDDAQAAAANVQSPTTSSLLHAVHRQSRLQGGPRLIARAKDMHYYTPEGRRRSTAPPGCGAPTPATTATPSSRRSRSRPRQLDFAPTFQFGHPRAFELASRIAALAPADLDHVFFCNSGSEAADTALKIALAYY